MARTWLSIRVELVSGRGEEFWPRPGRVFAAARSHSFGQLADAINVCFARWDLAHMHSFTVADGTQITPLDLWDGEAPEGSVDSEKAKLSRLVAGEQFAFVFDFGDDWSHLCTVAAERIDPIDVLGLLELPTEPMPYFGWGDLPDQYGRRWDTDDGTSPVPKRPTRALAELPPLLPWWGPRQRGQ
ncbi:IS1096 element passenger TnpR family protein [Phytohabitans kaempferiae]|uniref:Plasmid pRiA4b Orf3-like domain-containing protein n=1 Tax=Phytohabitans kaempferiae TaxID=1620943 RepID=A0ABV6ME75_9ACTN